jgi:hypothetical protein
LIEQAKLVHPCFVAIENKQPPLRKMRIHALLHGDPNGPQCLLPWKGGI